jgi:predicted tellurium resistance membrane protein TerC
MLDYSLIISFLTLTVMELVLGIDNIIFISLVSDRLPKSEQKKGRNIGLFLAMLLRVILLFGIQWVISLEQPLVFNFSGKDLVLLAGGLFLLYKTTTEIHEKIEKEDAHKTGKTASINFVNAVIQITLLNIVFSFDSILTAIGLVQNINVMIASVIASMILMMLFSGMISDFVNKHPTIKMLALSFLLLIGVLLIAESFKVHVEKGYVYFAMAFSFGVELLNMQLRKKSKSE